MSILIKGMRMPKYCRVCPFSIPLPIQLIHDELSSECVADSKRMKVCTDHYKRPKGCPLVKVDETAILDGWDKVYPDDDEVEPRYCDRNICASNEINGIGCDECVVGCDGYCEECPIGKEKE